MISLRQNFKSIVSLLLAVLALSVTYSCDTTTTPTTTPSPTPVTSNPREELVRSLKGASVEGFEFETKENDAQAVAMLTNSAVRNFIRMEQGDANVVLRYASVRDKKANSSTSYKSEIVKKGDSLSLVVTNLNTGSVVSTDTFPPPTRHVGDFNSLEECFRDFDCNRRGALQCEANRTCKPQFAALLCCLTNGQCFSIHLVIKPNTFKCLLLETVPELEGIVISR